MLFPFIFQLFSVFGNTFIEFPVIFHLLLFIAYIASHDKNNVVSAALLFILKEFDVNLT